MKLNNKKLLIGELYSLSFLNFQKYSDWFQKFKRDNFKIESNNLIIQIESDLLSMQDIDDSIESLRVLSLVPDRDHHECIKCKLRGYYDHARRYYF